MHDICVEGRVKGQIALVLRLVHKRFGEISDDLKQTLRSLPQEKLEALGEALLEVKSLDELRAMMH